MGDWNSVFEAYPDKGEIYVVDGMPFVEQAHAKSHAHTTGKPVETITRDSKPAADMDAEKAAKEAEKSAAKATKK